MTALVEDGTISMILTVPNVKELSHSMENLVPPSIPIYHGSIIHIEQHRDNSNKSDLIVRVPDFHHLSIPSVTISVNDDRTSETDSQRIKRRAPICPILNRKKSNVNQSELSHTKRLAIGLRNFRQAILAHRKEKQSTNIEHITIVPVLPDVEIIQADFQVRTSEKKNTNFTSKFFSPKILFIKRKKYTVNKKRPTSAENVVDTEENKIDETSRTDLDVEDKEIEQQNESNKLHQEEKINKLPVSNPQYEEQSTTIAQLIPKIPISLINPESTSTHQHSSDPQTSTNDLQPDAFESKAKMDLITDIQSPEKHDNDGRLDILHSNEDTCSEYYEVTYEFDPEFRHFLDQNNEQIYLPEVQDQSSVRFKLDSIEYQDLTSTMTPWLSILPSNDYEQIDQTHSEENSTHPHVEFQFKEDSSSSIPSEERHQTISLTDPSIINEDYTVILQFLKHALQIESIPDEDCNEFNQQIKEIFRSDQLHQLE